MFAHPQLLPQQIRLGRDDGWLVSTLNRAVVRIHGLYLVTGEWWTHEIHRAYHFAELRRGDCL